MSARLMVARCPCVRAGVDAVGFAVTASEGQEYLQSGASIGRKGVVLSSAERSKLVKAARTGVRGAPCGPHPFAAHSSNA